MMSFEYERAKNLFDINTDPKKLRGKVARINSGCNEVKATVNTETIKIKEKKTKNKILLVLLAWFNKSALSFLFMVTFLILKSSGFLSLYQISSQVFDHRNCNLGEMQMKSVKKELFYKVII